MHFTFEESSKLLRLLSEPTRLRLLVLLSSQELSVAELTGITGLSQSRISTHLGRLRRAGFLRNRRSAGATLCAFDPDHLSEPAHQLWGSLAENINDAQARRDAERAAEVVRQREHRQSWVESVAGRMERQYSPGRTWEAMARALIGLLDLGTVLDIASGDGVLAELLAGQARSVTCLDHNATVIAAARNRLRQRDNVWFRQGDMHALPFPDASFDQVFVMHALTFTNTPEDVIHQAARVLRPGGALVATTLARHTHQASVAAYDHVNLGFVPSQLAQWARDAGLQVDTAEITTHEQRPPYFEVVTLIAHQADAQHSA